MLVVMITASIHALALGQDHDAGKPNADLFARYVPASAGLFVTVPRVARADAALKRAHAWRLAPLLSGAAAPDDAWDLKRLIAGALGLTAEPALRELLGGEIRLAAPSWSRLDSAVWLFRLAEESALERWFPADGRMQTRTLAGVRLFRTSHGLVACQRGNTVALSRRWGSGSLLEKMILLMSRNRGESLGENEAFRTMMAHMPAGPLALAYLQLDAERDEDTGRAAFADAVDQALIGLYEGQGRLDVALLALRTEPSRQPRLSPAAMQRMWQLPRTTLGALTAAVDFDRLITSAKSRPPTALVERYLLLLSALLGVPDDTEASGPRLGPNVILAWGQDLRPDAYAPQVALLLECRNGSALTEQIRRGVADLIRLVAVLDPDSAGKNLKVERNRHLTVPIESVALPKFARASKLPWARLVENVEPSWAIWNKWLILTLSREHLEQILEAQFGLVPTLLTVDDVRAMRATPSERSVVALVQPGLAANVLHRWLKAHRDGDPSLLDPSWWSGDAGDTGAAGLGLEVRSQPDAGTVVVTRVQAGSAADGRIEPGDRILGIDGKLLPLTAPDAEFRRRLDGLESPATLRVRRGERLMDVIVETPRRREARAAPGRKPAEAVEQLAALGRSFHFVSFQVNASDPAHFSARLSIRLVPAHMTRAADEP